MSRSTTSGAGRPGSASWRRPKRRDGPVPPLLATGRRRLERPAGHHVSGLLGLTFGGLCLAAAGPPDGTVCRPLVPGERQMNTYSSPMGLSTGRKQLWSGGEGRPSRGDYPSCAYDRLGAMDSACTPRPGSAAALLSSFECGMSRRRTDGDARLVPCRCHPADPRRLRETAMRHSSRNGHRRRHLWPVADTVTASAPWRAAEHLSGRRYRDF